MPSLLSLQRWSQRLIGEKEEGQEEDPPPEARSAASSFCSNLEGMGTQKSMSSSSKNAASAFTAPPRYRNSGCFVHGTKFRHFNSIMEHGLKAIKSAIFMIDEVRADGRVPGLREPPEILIFIDEMKARSSMMEFDYDAAHGTWTTKGINGVIRPWFFQKVVDQRKKTFGNVLFQSKEDPMMVANKIRGVHRPAQLIHATYWQNVYGIMKDGIVPAKNPVSEFRRPFKDLLQGAESHVYTVPSSRVAERAAPEVPEVVPEVEGRVQEDEAGKEDPELSPEEKHKYTLSKDTVGLERPPDAFFVIDTKRAEEMGINLEMVQSADREQTVFIQGSVPRDLLTKVEPNDPLDLPDELRAKIVDPRSFNEIPIIDLSADEDTVVSQLQYACEVVGFMQVVGHGVSQDLLDRHFEMHRRFFQLPEEVKDALRLNEASPVRGYFGRGGEDLDQVLAEKVDAAEGSKIRKQARQDNKEALDTNGVPWSKPVGGYVSKIFGLPSRFPPEEVLADFGKVMDEYSAEMFRLSRLLLRLMARVLKLPEDFFEAHITNPVATHRLLHYWPIRDFKKEIGVGEHSDYGLLTILKQDSVGGLQVLNAKDGHWVHACPVEGAFVVNLGDMLARWTDHRFKSTIHRVVNTSPLERYSVPYFFEPNMDTEIVTGALCSRSETGDASRQTQSSGQAKMDFSPAPRGRRAQQDAETPDTAEAILERFYRASGQLKYKA
eukprot:TRINITY_DN55316_c0_g1_i1.p1 TRINITY_DN55316_c0_g1~~TRINITY_DN55316_c0_g1_i1.p1  ORF type:complete len:719 (+),score=166.69 TRINITY_DN55316_c0_g1_i1:84-2240(+)